MYDQNRIVERSDDRFTQIFFKVLDTLKAPDEVFATVIFYSTGYFDGWW